MNSMTKPVIREIIDDFAVEIKQRRKDDVKPSFEVISFRNWSRTNHEEKVWEVPTELLRFRKDNGRIASDVYSYEKKHGLLSLTSNEAQEIIREFLEKKDPEKTRELINSILHDKQREAAIITADGFLINGNRRKMALEKLWEETKDEKYKWMKVVILPGKDDRDKGGPPTIKEIEQIENRYQLQHDGKSEYYNFDRSLSIRRKINLGMSLEEQLRDDPSYARLPENEFGKVVKRYQDEFIEPLNCIDRYLEQLGREGLYYTISTGMSDREGRWQAFLDYSNHVRKKLDDDYKRLKMGIDENEKGDVEEIAFKIIRKREIKDLPKVHKIMRELPKWLANKEAKKELFKLLDIDLELPEDDCYDENRGELDERKKDQIWNKKHETTLNRQVKKAKQLFEHKTECETPITLLEAALSKLEHDNMDPEAVEVERIKNAMDLARKIQHVANILEGEFYAVQKNLKRLKDKHKKA